MSEVPVILVQRRKWNSILHYKRVPREYELCGQFQLDVHDGMENWDGGRWKASDANSPPVLPGQRDAVRADADKNRESPMARGSSRGLGRVVRVAKCLLHMERAQKEGVALRQREVCFRVPVVEAVHQGLE